MAQKKIAELTMKLSCGGMIQTYIPCKNEKDLLKKLKSGYKNGWGNFDNFTVRVESVISTECNIIGVQ